MLNKVNFVNTNGDVIELDSDAYPLHLFQPGISSRIEKRPRARADGEWPSFNYDEAMQIEMEGEILADDSYDYNDKRLALCNVIRFKPVTRLRYDGTLVINVDQTVPGEDWECAVTINEFQAPLNGASPGFSQFRLVVDSVTPYFVGSTTGAVYYYS